MASGMGLMYDPTTHADVESDDRPSGKGNEYINIMLCYAVWSVYVSTSVLAQLKPYVMRLVCMLGESDGSFDVLDPVARCV